MERLTDPFERFLEQFAGALDTCAAVQDLDQKDGTAEPAAGRSGIILIRKEGQPIEKT